MSAELHEVTAACEDVHCHSHDVDESDTPLNPGYIACHECGHLYRTKRELRREYRWGVQIGPFTFLAAALTPASRIHFCPLCMHDFPPRHR